MLKLLKCEKKDTIDSRRKKILDYFWYTSMNGNKIVIYVQAVYFLYFSYHHIVWY